MTLVASVSSPSNLITATNPSVGWPWTFPANRRQVCPEKWQFVGRSGLDPHSFRGGLTDHVRSSEVRNRPFRTESTAVRKPWIFAGPFRSRTPARDATWHQPRTVAQRLRRLQTHLWLLNSPIFLQMSRRRTWHPHSEQGPQRWHVQSGASSVDHGVEDAVQLAPDPKQQVAAVLDLMIE